MFEEPQAKRVRREELDEAVSVLSRNDSEDSLGASRIQDARFEFIEVQKVESDAIELNDNEDGSFAFNLFARPSRNLEEQPSSTVVQIAPTVDDVHATVSSRMGRPSTYYFTEGNKAYDHDRFGTVALSGEDVRIQSCRHCPGSRYPWKVVRIPSSQDKNGASRSNGIEMAAASITRKKRLGKKDRIKKRRRFERMTVAEAAKQAEKEDKERAEREKKARRNREKKFKKRARDKVKKQADGESGVDGDA